MLQIKEVRGYTIPMNGNTRTQPYGALLVTDGRVEKLCKIQEQPNGQQYITFRYHRYEVLRRGDLYHPVFKIGAQIPSYPHRRRQTAR